MTFTPVPKPEPRSESDRLTARIASSRKLNANRKPIPRSSSPSRTAPPKRKAPPAKRNAKRKASEFARCYGSRERVAWVKLRGCVAASLGDCGGPIDNAHVLRDGTEGMGRKGGFQCVTGLCRKHHLDFDQRRGDLGKADFRAVVAMMAHGTARAWRLHSLRQFLSENCAGGGREGR